MTEANESTALAALNPSGLPPAAGSVDASSQSTPANTSSEAPAKQADAAPAPPPGDGAPPADASGAPKRPDYIPESYWDSEKGQAKTEDLAEAIKLADSVKQTRANAVTKAEDFKVELPKDVKLPENYQIDESNPILGFAKELGVKENWSQEKFSTVLGEYAKLEAARIEASNAALRDAIKARDESLGPNGSRRIDDLNAFFERNFGEVQAKAMATTYFNKTIVETFESMMKALVNQGTHQFVQGGRAEAKDANSIEVPGWETMSPEQKFMHGRMAQISKTMGAR